MTEEELVKINIKDLTEEHARIVGMDILNNDIDIDKADVKKEAAICALLSGAMIISGVTAGANNPFTYIIGGVNAGFLVSFFNKLQVLIKEKRALKQFEQGTFNESYIDFVKETQDYVSKRRSIIEEHQKNGISR